MDPLWPEITRKFPDPTTAPARYSPINAPASLCQCRQHSNCPFQACRLCTLYYPETMKKKTTERRNVTRGKSTKVLDLSSVLEYKATQLIQDGKGRNPNVYLIQVQSLLQTGSAGESTSTATCVLKAVFEPIYITLFFTKISTYSSLQTNATKNSFKKR